MTAPAGLNQLERPLNGATIYRRVFKGLSRFGRGLHPLNVWFNVQVAKKSNENNGCTLNVVEPPTGVAWAVQARPPRGPRTLDFGPAYYRLKHNHPCGR